MTIEQTTAKTAADTAIALVRAKAPDARFGRFAANTIEGEPDYLQVTRVDKTGLPLANGWTFLVNTGTQVVTRTVANQQSLGHDFKEALRKGMRC
ncbi:MAG: hypothetical protein WA988_20505 [Candidatus Nanopelagicales bacterium]|jgi:hypothetical protein